MNFILYLLAVVTLVMFGGFGIFSYREKESRAVRVSTWIAVIGVGIFTLATLLGDELKLILLGLIGVGFLGLLVLSVLPIGRLGVGNEIPESRFDERDIMFARARFVPGSLNYESYYQMRYR